MHQAVTLKIMDYGRAEDSLAFVNLEELIRQAQAPDPHCHNDLDRLNSCDVGALERGISTHSWLQCCLADT